MVSTYILIISLFAVGFLAWLITKLLSVQKQTELKAELKLSQNQAEDLRKTNEQMVNELKNDSQQISELKQKKSELETRLDEQSKNLKAQIENLTTAKDQMKLEFENLAQKIFEEKGNKFGEQSKEQLGNLLSPLQVQIADFKKKVEQVYVDEGKERFNLTEQVKLMHESYKQMSQEANNLVRALKADTKTQGDWGEIILNRILENSGLKEGIHYQTQANFKTEEERALRPDVIIQLPGNRQIIVDSKVSIKAFDQYYNATTDTEREAALKAHILSIRNHIKELSAKKYDYIKEINSLDFVFMFVPIEAAFMVALDNDRDIFTLAYNQHVLLVCPSTLLVTLQMINSIWRVENQNRNTKEIADQGRSLLEKFSGFLDNLEDIQKYLSKSQEAYTAAHSQLFAGRGNLINQARKLMHLGVKVSSKAQEKLSGYMDNPELGDQGQISLENMQDGDLTHQEDDKS